MTRLPAGFLHAPLAHRGLHGVDAGCLENSRAAFAAACDAGYGIELDVQMSADGHAMVFHDYEMSRLTNESGPFRRHSAAELGRIHLKGCNETIPTLREVLVTIGGRTPLLIEIKDQDGAMGPVVGPLEQSVARALDAYTGPVAVMCFNPHSVAAFAEAAPDVPRGLVTGPFAPDVWLLLKEEIRAHLRSIDDYDRVGASFISHQHTDLSRPRVAELKAVGADVICWTVKSAADEAKARKIADNVTFEGYKADIPKG